MAAFVVLSIGLTASLLSSRSSVLLSPKQMTLLRGGQIGQTVKMCIDLDEKECPTTWSCYDAAAGNCADGYCGTACSATDVLEYRATMGSTYLEKPTYNPGVCGFVLNGATCQAYSDPNYPGVNCWCQGGVLPPPNQRVPCGQINDTDFTSCN